jgi:hypothetical protein
MFNYIVEKPEPLMITNVTRLSALAGAVLINEESLMDYDL